MSKKDYQLLEEAYISVTKKSTSLPSERETVTTEPNEVVSAGPIDEPAPGVDMDMIDSEVSDVEPEDKDTTGVPVDIMMGGEDHGHEEQCELDTMAIDNLNSIRESLMKLAMFCSGGNSLEAWQHQKIAIAMDNLAEVARRLH